MHPFTFEATIAPTATAIRYAGKDGAVRATLEIEGGPDALIAAAELAALIGKALRVTVEPYTPKRYGTQEE